MIGTRTIVMMVLVMGFVWGGFIFLLLLAMKRERRRKSREE